MEESRNISGRHRIVRLTLDERTVLRRSPQVEHERAVAIYDLIEDNHFQPVGDYTGPYHVRLGIEENRAVFDIRTEADESLGKVQLPLLPFRRIVKDYFAVCESYYQAIRRATPSQIEAIDMGRRGLHDEGSRLLRERLEGKVAIDHATARRLFTLLCVLHIRG
ncbi:MAG: UPF0262 family protein [Thalassobaculales bacterium]